MSEYSETTHTMVMNLLRSIPARLRDMQVYKYELQDMAQVTYAEMIEALALEHGQSQPGGHAKGKVSDKTSDAALNYEKLTDKLNEEAVMDIVKHIKRLDDEQRRLEAYINTLPANYIQVLRGRYFEPTKSMREIAEIINVSSVRTVRRLHTQAVDELCRLYELVEFA